MIKIIFFQKKTKYLFFILFIFLVSIIIVNPIGEFALNDDWFYYDAVRQFNFSNFKLDSWITPALIGQLFYSNFLVEIFGFSFSILRLSTLFLSLIGIIFLYKLLVNLEVSPKKSFFISVLFLFNPIFFNLSFTFMTDVPALSLVIVALYFYQKGFSIGKDVNFFIANLLIIYASIIRQNYIIILILFIILFLWQRRKRLTIKQLIFIILFPLILFFFLFLYFKQIEWWPKNDFKFHSFEELRHLFDNFYFQLYSVWQYVALLISPLIVNWLFYAKRKLKITALFFGILASFFNIYLFFYNNLSFPYSGNIINRYGLGARDPNGVLTGTPDVIINNNLSFWLSVAVGFFAGVLLVMAARSVIKILRNKTEAGNFYYLFILLNLLTQWLVILTVISFDRYYLAMELLFLILLIPIINKRKINIVSVIIIVILMVVSIVGTHSYLRENQLKWFIANNLIKNNILPKSIDAGYEWLGWNWYHYRNLEILPYYDPDQPWYITKIFPDNTREFVISYNPSMADYKLIGQHSYKDLFLNKHHLFVLKYAPEKNVN